jgi:hypothetical protein
MTIREATPNRSALEGTRFMPIHPALLLLTLAAAQPEPPPVPPLPEISPLAPPGWTDPAAPRLPTCPPPPEPPVAPATPGLAIADIPFAPADIASAEQTWEAQTGQPVVHLTLTESGRRKFQDLQRTDCESQILEIRVDGELLSSPVLRERIEGAEITISGSFTEAEAEALAARLGGPAPSD